MSATYLLSAKTARAPRSSSASEASSSGHSDAVWCTKAATLASGQAVVVTGSADHTVKTWLPEQLESTQTHHGKASLGIVGLDVDPSSAGAKFLIASSLDSVISRYSLDPDNAGGGQPEGRKVLGPGESWRVSIHPNAEVFATAGFNSGVRIMSAAEEDFGATKGQTGESSSGTFGLEVVYSPDGKYLAVATETGHVILYDANTLKLVSTFPAHSAPIRCATFTSSLLITASDDKRINVFDLRALSVSANSAPGGGGRKGQVASLGGHEGWVVSLAARNDRLLASGSSDGTVKLWDMSALGSSAISTLRDDATVGDVWSMAWLPDTGSAAVQGLQGASAGIGGGKLVSGSQDGIARLWRSGG